MSIIAQLLTWLNIAPAREVVNSCWLRNQPYYLVKTKDDVNRPVYTWEDHDYKPVSKPYFNRQHAEMEFGNFS